MRPARSKKSSLKSCRRITIVLSEQDRIAIAKAAKFRQLSEAEYVLAAATSQAKHDIASPDIGEIRLTPAEQLAFWRALHRPAKLTRAQKQLGKIIRGQA